MAPALLKIKNPKNPVLGVIYMEYGMLLSDKKFNKLRC